MSAVKDGMLLGKFEAGVRSYMTLPRPRKLERIMETLEEIDRTDVVSRLSPHNRQKYGETLKKLNNFIQLQKASR